ncbi:hypothetical protein F2Q70_00036235 [Brassica cretica]|uniref:Uncharacterized protein n=1 Tax=Brassica cretica TaxID=69181 RepID=A0A8S9JYY7_BRACR|nr:hypothetical protein F2Q70_00036235 [Brassica cretica]
MRCFSSAPKKTYFLILFFIAFFTLRFLLMLRTASLWVGSRTAPRFDDYVLYTLPSMFPHLIAVCVSLTLPFAMFTTPDLDHYLLDCLGHRRSLREASPESLRARPEKDTTKQRATIFFELQSTIFFGSISGLVLDSEGPKL